MSSIAESLRKAGYLQPVANAFNQFMAKRDYDEKMNNYLKLVENEKQNINNSLTPKLDTSIGMHSLMPKSSTSEFLLRQDDRTPSNIGIHALESKNEIPSMGIIPQQAKMQMSVQDANISDVRNQVNNSIYDLMLNAVKNEVPNDISQIGLKALANYSEGVLPKPKEYKEYDPKKGMYSVDPNTNQVKIEREPQVERNLKTVSFDNKLFEYDESTGNLRPLVNGSFKADGTITEGGIEYAYKIGPDGKPIKTAIGKPDKKTVHHTGNGGGNSDEDYNQYFKPTSDFIALLNDDEVDGNKRYNEALYYLPPRARAWHDLQITKAWKRNNLSEEEFENEIADSLKKNEIDKTTANILIDFNSYRSDLLRNASK